MDSGTARGWSPGTNVRGRIAVPGSKSIAQRVLAVALLAEGTTSFAGLPAGRDVMQALRCARAGGARFPSEAKPDDLLATALIPRLGTGRILGAPMGDRERARDWATFHPGESGTTARIYTAIAALARPSGSGSEVVPEGSLLQRSSPALFDALRRAGAGIEHASEAAPAGSWPALLTSTAPPTRLELIQPSSSQEVSALLIAAAAHRGPIEVRVSGAIPSAGYVAVTLQTLEQFGAVVTREEFRSDVDAHAGVTYRVQGPLVAPRATVRIEADASSAAVALAAGVLCGGRSTEGSGPAGEGTSVEGIGLGSAQPDVGIVAALGALGCNVTGSSEERLAVSGVPRRGGTIDCSRMPDAAPVLAAVAAFVARSGEPVHLKGLETLPGKESQRIEVLARGLRTVGYRVEHDDRSLSVLGSTGVAREAVVLDPEGDHRMAFAFALLSLFETGVSVSNPGCVSKSWPSFWETLGASSAPDQGI